MGVCAGTYSGGTGGLGKLLLGFIAMAVIFAMVVQLNMHSVIAHGSDAEAVHNCFKQNGEMARWEDTLTGKIYRVCSNYGEWYGIQVVRKNVDSTYREITSFIRKRHGKLVTNFSDVEKYILNQLKP